MRRPMSQSKDVFDNLFMWHKGLVVVYVFVFLTLHSSPKVIICQSVGVFVLRDGHSS